MTTSQRWRRVQRQLGSSAPLILLILVATSSSLIATESCCADCLAQTDPVAVEISYDPLVHTQCSAAAGICCYDCSFPHGSPEYQGGVTFDSNGTAQASAGQRLRFAVNDVTRVTYEFLRTGQPKTSFVGNESKEASRSGDAGVFSVCVDDPGTIAFRGWGADPCTQVTIEYSINVVEGAGTTTCEAENDGGSLISASSVASMPAQPVDAKGGDAMNSAPSGESDFENCNPRRGTVLSHSNGSRYCECTGDWRNPPTCDEFSYLKAVLTILGALATVLSILFSVRAFIKSRKDSKAETTRKAGASGDNDKEGDSDGDDTLSINVIHIGGKLRLGTPGSRGKLPLGTLGFSLPQPSLPTDASANPPKETTL